MLESLVLVSNTFYVYNLNLKILKFKEALLKIPPGLSYHDL